MENSVPYVEKRQYELLAWFGVQGKDTTWQTINVTAESFSVENKVLKFWEGGRAIAAYSEGAWQKIREI